MGDLVTEPFAYDGGRDVTVFLPSGRPELVVYAGDGQLVAGWGRELEDAGVPPTMVVGVHRSDDADEMVRVGEYSPSVDPARFAAHETFVVDEVRGWVRSRFDVGLPAVRTAAYGMSAGGELALALGLRHPDVYGTVFCASPGGGYRPPAVLPAHLPRAYLVAGTLEPWFRDNAVRWAEALRAADADVVMTERVGGHGDAFWRTELPRMVAWLFGH